MPKLRVLIVDDAVVVRKILTDSLSADPDLEVVTAANGRIALAKLAQVNPDVVTLDFEMPEMDGLATLKAIRQTHPKLPVIMFSTLTERGAAVTFDALAAGANDYVTKPANVGSVGTAIARINDELIPKIKSLCGRHAPAVSGAAELKPGASCPVRFPRPAGSTGPGSMLAAGAAGNARFDAGGTLRPATRIEMIAIGVSTGGPNALSALLPTLAADFPVPIAIVQHMPPVFTRLLAERLAGQCALKVRESEPGMTLGPGELIIAAGGSHMTLERTAGIAKVASNMDPPENSCRPAVDQLFRSVARGYGASALAVVLTGMGSDGLRGCEHIREAGGDVVVQDEASSVVWGMPGFVAKAGLAGRVLPLTEIGTELTRRAWEGRKRRKAG